MKQPETDPNSKLSKALEALDVEGVKSAIGEGAKASNPVPSAPGPDTSSVIANFIKNLCHGMLRIGHDNEGRVTGRHQKEFARKLGEVLTLLQNEGGLDVNASMGDGRTLLMGVAEYAGSLPGYVLMDFLLKNGADPTTRVKQQTTEWSDGRKVPAGEVDADVLTSLLSGHGEHRMHMIGLMEGGGRENTALERARTLYALLKAGAPLDGTMNGHSVVEEILSQHYPVGSIGWVIEAMLDRVQNITEIPDHDRLLHAVLSQSINGLGMLRENHSQQLTSILEDYEKNASAALMKIATRLIEAGADVNAEVEFKSIEWKGNKRVENSEKRVPLETAMKYYNRGAVGMSMVGGEVPNTYGFVQLLLENGARVPDRMVDTHYATSDIKIAFAKQQMEAGEADSTQLLEREITNSNGEPDETYLTFLLQAGAKVSRAMLARLQ